MKKSIVILFASIIALCAFINKPNQSAINGTVEPPDGANKVWAIMGNDSSYAVPSSAGKFSIPVKPGTWILIVEAIKPYKNALVPNIVVLEGGPTDVGVIKLEKEVN